MAHCGHTAIQVEAGLLGQTDMRLAFGKILGLSKTEGKTVGIETSVQNSPLGITLAIVITGTSTSLSDVPMALPSALYSITMYLVVLPFMFYFRWRSRGDVRQSVAAE
ncbi:hypothetical protein [Ruegeria lacuscaerulensis]|uniref:hypothetical protein n=1 Tax=Ruegeria lacuscaerulensis TaxID=55218 RepID=UPI00147ADA20|nr:hypothetical protein [Ruegeria lacuscaerulensis]